MQNSTEKKAKIIVHKQKFLAEYSKIYPCFTASKIGEKHAFCRVCSTDILNAHAGMRDLNRHVATKKHTDLVKLTSNAGQKKISSMFQSTTDDNTVINAEVIFTKFLIENNLPLAVSDSAGNMFRRMFPDSSIATKYACARTKC